MLKLSHAKKIIDLKLDASISAYNRIYEARQTFRDRGIRLISFILGIIGVVIAVQFSEQRSFFDLLNTATSLKRIVLYILFIATLALYVNLHLITKTTVLVDQYQDMLFLVDKVLLVDYENTLKLEDEKMEVDCEYYFKVDLLKSYSAATNQIIKSIKTFKKYFIASLLVSIVTLYLILNIVIEIK